jgi:hypothetical protein
VNLAKIAAAACLWELGWCWRSPVRGADRRRTTVSEFDCRALQIADDLVKTLGGDTG